MYHLENWLSKRRKQLVAFYIMLVDWALKLFGQFLCVFPHTKKQFLGGCSMPRQAPCASRFISQRAPKKIPKPIKHGPSITHTNHAKRDFLFCFVNGGEGASGLAAFASSTFDESIIAPGLILHAFEDA
jgi:hypothetical protein